MTKLIRDKKYLTEKLTKTGFKFTDLEFEELMTKGYYHIINSYTRKSLREKSEVEKHVSDLLHINLLDNKFSSIFFSIILKLENHIKQRVNDVILENILSNNDDKPFKDSFLKWCVKESKREKTEKDLQDMLEKISSDNLISKHFNNQIENMPIWSILELMSLGNLLYFVTSLNNDLIYNLDIKMGFNPTNVHKNFITPKLLHAIKNMRNNIAHNQPIIDARFINRNQASSQNTKYLINEIKRLYKIAFINNSDEFDTTTFNMTNIIDYCLLLAITCKICNIAEDDIANLSEFLNLYILPQEHLKSKKLYAKILGTDFNKKIIFLTNLII